MISVATADNGGGSGIGVAVAVGATLAWRSRINPLVGRAVVADNGGVIVAAAVATAVIGSGVGVMAGGLMVHARVARIIMARAGNSVLISPSHHPDNHVPLLPPPSAHASGRSLQYRLA
jgi:hypothetical protein